MHIEDGRVVLIHYKLSDHNEKLLDESLEDEPLAYLHGAAGIIPGLEDELAGKSAGDIFDVTIDPDDAYGDHMPEAVSQVPRTQFDADLDIQPGMQFSDDTGGSLATVTAVDSEFVTMDANHPLAGLTLRFKGAVVEVREPTGEELKELQVSPGSV
jgi:FKBP-type peptidyl-prolyl cis-trans isomerase SlyD